MAICDPPAMVKPDRPLCPWKLGKKKSASFACEKKGIVQHYPFYVSNMSIVCVII
jgi:hypothetical protein